MECVFIVSKALILSSWIEFNASIQLMHVGYFFCWFSEFCYAVHWWNLFWQVYFLTKEEGGRPKPYTNNFQAQMFCKTWDAPIMMELPTGKDLIMPGEDCGMKFSIRKQMARYLITKLLPW